MSGFIEYTQKRRNKKKKNLLSNFIQSFYKNFLDGVDFSQDNNFQQTAAC